MSKSLNFVVSIRLDKRSQDSEGKHPIKLRVWNRASKKAKMYSCNKFADTITFNRAVDQKTTVKGETFKLRLYLDRILSNSHQTMGENDISSFNEFERLMFNRTEHAKNLVHYIDLKIDECHRNIQFSSRDIYKGLKRLINDFSQGNQINVDALSVKWFKSLENWYLSRKKSNGDSYKVSGYSIYMRHLRIIINDLVEREIISRKNYPFGKRKYIIPSLGVGHWDNEIKLKNS